METVMFARFLMIAAASTLVAGVAFAEPARPAASQPNSSSAHPAPVVLASADPLNPAPPQAQSNAAPKHRALRVTNCRCGDPQTQTEEQQ
jgi:hypothetical protein